MLLKYFSYLYIILSSELLINFVKAEGKTEGINEAYNAGVSKCTEYKSCSNFFNGSSYEWSPGSFILDNEIINNNKLFYFQETNQCSINDQNLVKDRHDNFAINSTADYKYKKTDILFNNIKKAIDEYSVISFDIFDTLLIRPYVNPKDLFIHLENLNNATGFAKSRIEAERKARRKLSHEIKEITFDEIYQQIESKYKWLKEKELEHEYNGLKARSFIKDVYNYAILKNKRVIIISDMYLSKKFLENVLRKCGYNNYERLFVSSEYGKTKSSGLLYNMVLKKLNISLKDILHIGDNLKSDISEARKIGINAFYIPNVVDVLFETDPRLKEFYMNHNNNLGVSIILGLLASHNENVYKNYWYEFGYTFAGPVIFGYMQWLDEKIKKDKIEKVLFISRDGYPLEKVYNLIKTSDTNTYYIYLPRKIARKCMKGKKDEIEKARKEYLLYLSQFDLNDNRLAMVDSMTRHYTSQRSFVTFFPEKYIKGYYWFVLKDKYENLNFESYQNDHIRRIGNLIELFMTAPTPPIDTIENGKPIFKEITNNEAIRIKLYPELCKGAIDFSKDYLENFGTLKGFFTSEMLIDWINIFKLSPTEIDKNMFFNLEHAGDANHHKYVKMFEHWYNLPIKKRKIKKQKKIKKQEKNEMKGKKRLNIKNNFLKISKK